MHVLTPGAVLGGCRVEDVVGRGGMGVVYRARQMELDRVVAVKVLAPNLTDDPAARDRFLSEARAAGAVEHPHVVPVHSAGVTEDGVAYLVLRYVVGEDLHKLVAAAGTLTPERTAAIARQLGAALDAIHAAGYVHRDVKPRNVLVDDSGNAYLSDFGLAKEALASSGPTPSEQWVGTLDYVAPEQLRGEQVDRRADVYSFGGVVFFMLTGRAPFGARGGHAKLWAHLFEAPPSLLEERPDAPAVIDAAVRRALAKDPDQRQATAGELARAVAGESVAEEQATAATRTAATVVAPRAPRPLRSREPRRWTRGVALGVLGVVAAVAAVALTLGGTDDNGAPTPTPTPTQAPGPKPPADAGVYVGPKFRGVGFRPHEVAVAAGRVFVASYREPGLVVFDERSGKRSKRVPLVGHGVTAMAAHRDEVWVAVPPRREVVRVGPREVEEGDRLRLTQRPVEVALGPSGLWIACQEASGEEGATVLRYDRTGQTLLQTEPLSERIGAVTEAAGSLWLAPEDEHYLLRITTEGDVTRELSLRGRAESLASGAGAVWASVPDANAVVRLDLGTGVPRTRSVETFPEQLAITRGRAFVAGNTSDTVFVLDGRSGALLDSLKVAPNPYGVAASGPHVWVTGESNTLTRLDVEP